MSDLQERNARAVMQALTAQDAKLQEYHNKIVALQMQVNGLQNELVALKQKNMQELVAKFGAGPTVGVTQHGDKH